MLSTRSKLNLSEPESEIRPPRAQRFFDLSIAIPGILVLSPALIIIALLIKLGSRGPVLFRQPRVGRYGRVFKILKFRTMIPDAEKRGAQLTIGRDPRITRIGYFLRSKKLDELPQLFNVIKGEMSIVGPRPEVPRYVARYNEQQRQILGLRPGLTSTASIAFHDENELLAGHADPEQFYCAEVIPIKIGQDLDYARNATIWSDCTILAKTFSRILRSRCSRERRLETTKMWNGL